MDIATAFGVTENEDLMGFRIGNALVDLQTPVNTGGAASPIYLSDDSPDARHFYWHSFSHIMAQAVKRLHPGVKLGTGPAVENGFYYDFEREEPFASEDLIAIEEEMKRIILADFPFERMQVTAGEARFLLTQCKESLKLELLDELLSRGDAISFYKDGEFIDMCKGPHVLSTRLEGYFKLWDIGDAYWRGDERRQVLQRIYGTAFLRKDDLTDYLASVEEAKKRDHRKLGRELDLFSISNEVGPGLLLWHSRGEIIREVIEGYYRKRHREAGYDFVHTPHIGKCELWKTSGHLDFYRDEMFPGMEIEGQTYYLKPMNCPFHAQIYKSRLRSYRDLPLRFAEWGSVYRFEREDTLHGAARVRGFTQDDAHLFCSRGTKCRTRSTKCLSYVSPY
jgi:threonyl-tRNA synthetase